MRGKIKSVKPDRGFGFLEPIDGGADLFFHVKQSPAIPFDESIIGRAVTFETQPSDRGPRAVDVRLAS